MAPETFALHSSCCELFCLVHCVVTAYIVITFVFSLTCQTVSVEIVSFCRKNQVWSVMNGRCSQCSLCCLYLHET